MTTVEIETPYGPLKFTLTVRHEQFDDLASSIESNVEDKHALWARVGGIARESFRKSFAFAGKPSWTPLAPSTVASKRRFFNKKPNPPFSKNGQPLKRFLQNDILDEQTILIRTGALRDSWVRKGARGHAEWEGSSGKTFFVGSQLTLDRVLKPDKPLKHYHILTKRAMAARSKGKTVVAQIPLARFHEEGTKNMPARPVGVLWEVDMENLRGAAASWFTGENP